MYGSVQQDWCTRHIADNIPFDSLEMRRFAKDWNFQVVTRSPGYPQSNGLAEKGVGLVKEIMRKNNWKEDSFYQGLLEHRNLPLKHIGYSPAQLMLGRICKTSIPVSAELLKPAINEGVLDKLEKRQNSYITNYNRSAKDLPKLIQGDKIWYKHGAQWKQGNVKESASAPRSFLIKGNNGAEYRRNRRDLKLSADNIRNKCESKAPNNSEVLTNSHQPLSRPIRNKRLPIRYQN